MSLKEAAEKNIALFVLGLLFTGFIAGIGAHKALLEIVGQKSTSESEQALAGAQAENQRLAAQLSEIQKKVSGLTSENERFQKQLSAPPSGNTPSTAALDSGSTGATLQVALQEGAQRIKNFEFSLQGCEREGADIVCWIMVTNRDVDRDLWVSYESRMIDDAGDQHRQSARIFGGNETRYGNIKLALASNVPTRLGLRFQGVAGKTRQVKLLEVIYNDFPVQWRNIQVG